jgi:hypothetical protein
MTYTAHEVLGGIYEKTVKMTVSRRLRYAPCAQAGWRDHETVSGNTAAVLYSYSSKIATVWLDAYGTAYKVDTTGGDAALNCSRTTSRQFTLAMRECGLSDRVIRALKPALAGGDMVVLKCGKWILHSTGEVIA